MKRTLILVMFSHNAGIYPAQSKPKVIMIDLLHWTLTAWWCLCCKCLEPFCKLIRFLRKLHICLPQSRNQQSSHNRPCSIHLLIKIYLRGGRKRMLACFKTTTPFDMLAFDPRKRQACVIQKCLFQVWVIMYVNWCLGKPHGIRIS